MITRQTLGDSSILLLQGLVDRLLAGGERSEATALRTLLIWQERDKAANESADKFELAPMRNLVSL